MSLRSVFNPIRSGYRKSLNLYFDFAERTTNLMLKPVSLFTGEECRVKLRAPGGKHPDLNDLRKKLSSEESGTPMLEVHREP